MAAFRMRAPGGFRIWRLATLTATQQSPFLRRVTPLSTSIGMGSTLSHSGRFGMAGMCAGVGSYARRGYSTSVPSVDASSVATEVPDVHEVVSQSEFEVLSTVATTWKHGDLVEAGMGSYYTPVGLLQHFMDYIHLDGGLPWWATIIVSTITIRTLCLPLMIAGLRNGVIMNNIKPEIDQLSNKTKELMAANRQTEAQIVAQKVQDLWRKHDIHPLKQLSVPLIQMPVFISFFFAVRNMCDHPIPTMTDGGLFWFTDLSLSDPYYILPVISSSTMLLSAELGADGIPANQSQTFKNILRGAALLAIPMTSYFPSGVFMYWLTANFFSLTQMQVLKMPAVRNALNIPARIEHAAPASKPLDVNSISSKLADFKADFTKGYNSVVGNKEETPSRKLYKTKQKPKRRS